jgi:hypothetical protein
MFRWEAELSRVVRFERGDYSMPFLPSIDTEDKVPHVLAKFQNGTQMPLLEFHQALLRGDSPFSVKERELRGSERRVLEVEHTVEGGTSVETHVSGAGRHVAVLESLVSRDVVSETDFDLSDREREVLMALYSGVSPFEIPDFLGMDVDDVEAVFDRLCETGLLREKRVRREVRLKARGRNIASDVIADQ